MEEGYWVEVGNMRSWVSSMHLVPERETQLRRMQEHWEMHRQQQQATGGVSVPSEGGQSAPDGVH